VAARANVSDTPERRAQLALAARTACDAEAHVRTRGIDARSVRSAAGRDIKIEADFLLDQFIRDRLTQTTGLPVVSEESGGMPVAGDYWVVDPLDGSFNFARGLPFCAISIALWEGQAPIVGVVHDFARGECFSGLVGVGAWLNDEPIRPSGVSERAQAVLCTGVPLGNAFGSEAAAAFVGRLRAFKKIRLLGSAALMLAYVACGRADMYSEDAIALWDVAAGLAIVKAAGGHVAFRPNGNQALLDVEATNGVLAHDAEGWSRG
jgi:myo-inositol-1(or 4)-monophosphatase